MITKDNNSGSSFARSIKYIAQQSWDGGENWSTLSLKTASGTMKSEFADRDQAEALIAMNKEIITLMDNEDVHMIFRIVEIVTEVTTITTVIPVQNNSGRVK